MAGGPLTDLVTTLLRHLDAERFDEILALAADDVQGVDEISEGWLRGRAAMARYYDGLRGQVAGIRSTFRDPFESVWGDVGVVTGTLEQTYEQGGETIRIVAPTSVLFRRDGGAWKVALLHSVPLPEE